METLQDLGIKPVPETTKAADAVPNIFGLKRMNTERFEAKREKMESIHVTPSRLGEARSRGGPT